VSQSSSSNGPVNLAKGQLLFDEGTPSDAMYVVKSGAISIVKKKGTSEIELAKVMPGQLFGEMAFFDDKPRSAGARATKDGTVVIALPFKSLHAQFRQFPEWLKAMVKTVNENLRTANKRIKELERSVAEEEQKFPPHTINKLCGIFALTAAQFSEKEEGGMALSWNVLRRYTIQVFQEATNKMETLLEVFAEKNLLTVEKLGEGRRKILIKDVQFFVNFVEFYNEYLYAKEESRITIEKKELPIIRALIYYGNKATLDKKGMAKVLLDEVRKESVKDLDYLVDTNQYESLIAKKAVSEKSQEANGLSISFDPKELARILPFWELLFSIQDRDPAPKN
jgi:CRP/FNR family transcriptional regulator, cyclic AMP receptor protein